MGSPVPPATVAAAVSESCGVVMVIGAPFGMRATTDRRCAASKALCS
jgi:hypothetical protein